MKDIRITSFRLNSRNELSCRIVIKDWDYTIAEKELLRQAENDWNLLDLNIVWLVNWEQEQNKKKKLQILNMSMLTYAEKSWYSMDFLKQTLFNRYWVISRKDMNIEDIEREIDTYRLWILEFN